MPTQSLEDMSWLEKLDLLRKFSKFPAITVMVFIRRRIGFRMLNPTWLIVMWVIMLVVPALFAPAAKPFGFFMVAYAFAMLGLGIFQRRQRWKELCGHVHWYTYSTGISWLEGVRLPQSLKSNPHVTRFLDPVAGFFQSHYRIHRILDPAATILAGILIALFVSHGLGLWIIFSGFFLYVFEQDVYERSINHDLDILDGMYISELQAKVVDAFKTKTPQEQQKSPNMDETSGIPTGLAPDLHMKVQVMQLEITRKQQFSAGQQSGRLPNEDIPI
jgi:hypothetical protein